MGVGKRTLIAIALGLVALAGPASADPGPEGNWIMANGKVTVRINQCGNNLCGTIIRLKEPLSKIDGKPKIDRDNPNPALRTRPIIGLSILLSMKPAGASRWKGAIYNPDDGKTYSGSVKLDGDSMKVQGCVLSIFCKTNEFIRTN